jgi:hypothetical protein
MKIVTLVVLTLLVGCTACDIPYVKVGAGYKIDETDDVKFKDTGETWKVDKSSPISARIDAGYHCKKGVTMGISHHSQWLSGSPFNDNWEHHKTELFVDKEWQFGR